MTNTTPSKKPTIREKIHLIVSNLAEWERLFYGNEINAAEVTKKEHKAERDILALLSPQTGEGEKKPSGQEYWMECTKCKTIYDTGEIHYCGKVQPPQPSGQGCKCVCHTKKCVNPFSDDLISCKHCQPPQPPLQGKQDWEGEVAEVYEVAYAYVKHGDEIYCAWCKRRVDKWTRGERNKHVEAHDFSVKEMKKKLSHSIQIAVEEAIHTAEKRMIEEMDKLVFEASDGIHTYGPIVWQIDKEGYDKLKSKVNHSKQG